MEVTFTDALTAVDTVVVATRGIWYAFTQVARQLFGNFWPFEQLLSNLRFRAFFSATYGLSSTFSATFFNPRKYILS